MESSRSSVEESMTEDNECADFSTPRHCVRHITSIQVRNLTPFPARDTFASALTQRTSFSPVGPGLASDDADMLLSRRRSRKMSSASIATLKSVHSGESHDQNASLDATPTGPRIRTRAGSRASMRSSGIGATPSMKRQPHTISPGTTPTLRRPRQRTASQTSILDSSVFNPTSSTTQTSSALASSSSWLTDVSSQKELEKVIWSRLVETFLTISPPWSEEQPLASPSPDPSSSTGSPKKVLQATGSMSRRAGLNNSSDSLRSGSSPTASTRQKRQPALSSTASAKARSRSSSPARSLNGSARPQSGSAPSQKITFPHSPPPTPPPAVASAESSVPIFISPFHRPSTNPKFMLDQIDREFANWADLTADSVVIRLWGHVGTEWGKSETKGKGKEKDTAAGGSDDEGGEWKVISIWDLNLSDLVPLPEDLAQHPSKLPSNTLLLTLSPSNRTYYLPSMFIGATPIPSRSNSPGHNSDSEITAPRARRHVYLADGISPVERGRQRKVKRDLKSTGWNELVKLVSLQSSLTDAQNLLHGVLQTCNQLVEEDRISLLRREASQREYRLQVLQEQRDSLDDNIRSARDSIESRREELRQRRIRLAEARALHEDDLLTEFDAGVELAEERKRVNALKAQIEPIRTSLLLTLAFIFPIEVLSPPDLLFTILSVPLAIPLTGTDPAPPLFLASFSEVNEDSVATALGYAAHLVHLMAVYLCRGLVYPITYIGSRSLIKDPISAMMGPRMFPLYSKGVDTYRFEYAVFLLNKDIEMLMADRNLRALDLRHTLPNLKNLLLTLTSGESALPKSRPLPSPSISSGLQSPERASSPPPLDLAHDDATPSPGTTPKAGSATLPPSASDASDSEPSVAAGSRSASISSSTASSVASFALKPKVYLGFAPITSMFRTRYPSSSAGGKPSVRAVDEAPEENAEGETGSPTTESPGGGSAVMNDTAHVEDDEDDRRTIRGASTPVSEIGPNGRLANGFSGSENEEKQGEGGELANAAATVEAATVTHVR